MSTEIFRTVLPLVPEAVALLAALLVVIVRRRRLGATARTALAGFALLVLATAGSIAWRYWTLTREGGRIVYDNGEYQYQPPIGRELTRDLDVPVTATLMIVYLVGLVLVTAAVFMSRRSQTTMVSGAR